ERGRRGLILVMSPLVGAIGFGLVAIDLIALVRGQEFGVLSGIGIVLMILCAANESDSTVSSLSAAGMVFWRRPATDPQIRSVETLPAAEQSDPPKSPVGREFES
ncbi:MAG: hypothetical protein KDB22_28585, partial [Planctomycetales bacterium]|nr:hypothetical protein [Planctomycetales bacterium]